MANIAIINYCNLQCPYCFANRYITEEEKSLITLEQFDEILNFLGRSADGRIGIIGGEPTLHPQFRELIQKSKKFCKEKKHFHTAVFTNGINLYEYADLFDDKTGGLINVNHPDILGKSKWGDFERSLKRLNLRYPGIKSINLGINLYPNMLEYDYIFDLALKYNKDSLRTSYVAPTCNFSKVDKEEYYNSAKNIFIPFVEKAKSLGLKIRLDCNHIPRCYFTENELNILDGTVEGWHSYCNPVVDITPEMKATPCFGAYELIDLKEKEFETIQEVERYFLAKKMLPKAEKNCGGKCSSCKKHKNMSCQGGCLAFVH